MSLVDRIELGLRTGELKEEFTCWECGRQVFWTEVNGNLEDKLRGLEENYCGC